MRDIEFAAADSPTVVTDQRRYRAEQVVLAAGAWSRDFAIRLGARRDPPSRTPNIDIEPYRPDRF